MNKRATCRAWWRRRLDALDLTPRQRRKVEMAVRLLLDADAPVAIYRTTRGTCEVCVSSFARLVSPEERPPCTCAAEPEIVIDLEKHGGVGVAVFMWIQRTGFRDHIVMSRDIATRVWGLTKVYEFTERDQSAVTARRRSARR